MPVKHVTQILDQNEFSFSAEIIPPRNGTDFKQVFEKINYLSKSIFKFISVTHGAGGSLRGGTLPICYHAQAQESLTSIAHLTCRSLTKEDLENHLIDHHYFGISNILALRGDPPTGIGMDFTPIKNGFSFAFQLIELLSNMNAGRYLIRQNFDDTSLSYKEGVPTDFCIGSTCYPEDPNSQRVEYLKIKKEKGAHFAISQMIYSAKEFIHFYKEVFNILGDVFPVLPGIRIPTSYKQLDRMKNTFNINVPDDLLKVMYEASQLSDEKMKEVGLKWAEEFVYQIYDAGIKGVHLFIMNDLDAAIKLRKKFI